MNGNNTVNGVLNTLSNLSSVNARALLPLSVSITSGLVPTTIVVKRTESQMDSPVILCVAAEKKMSANKVNTSVNFNARTENVSNSRNRNRAVLSNTIIASARIPMLVRNSSGNAMRSLPRYCDAPKNIPMMMSNNTSGTLSLRATQEQTTPTKRSTAMDVVIVSASMCAFIFDGYLNVC